MISNGNGDKAFEVYRMYLALKLHFTTDQYNVIDQQGRVRASKQSFFKRKDMMSINKVAKKYSDKEIANFLIANFVSGDRWGGMFDVEAAERYIAWKKRMESLQYQFESDVDLIQFEMEKIGETFEHAFKISNSEHPYILKSYMRGTTSIETLVILDTICRYSSLFDAKLDADLVWPDLSRTIRKYKPFLKFSKEKYDGLFRRRVGLNEKQDQTH